MKEQREIADLTIQLLPGLFTEASARASINRWKDGDKVRFQNKLPQKLGGWTDTAYTLADPTQPLIGNPRNMKTWTTLNGQEMTAFGTGSKLYILNQNILYDITPQRLQNAITPQTNNISGITVAAAAVITINTVSVTNPYSVGMYIAVTGVSGMTQINGLIGQITAIGGSSGAWTITTTINSSTFSAWTSGGIVGNGPLVTKSGSPIVTVLFPGHGANVGDYVYISNSSAVGGLTLAGQYQVVSANYQSYTINAGSNASSTAQGGGTVTFAYDINAGLDSPGFFFGWGSGTWGTGTWGTPRSQNQVTNITNAAQAVVTVSTVSATNPFTIGGFLVLSSVAGMTQINGIVGQVVSIGGVSGAWTATVNINSTGFSAYISGGVASVSTMPQPVRIWSLDNWGQDLMASYRGGPVFHWDANLGLKSRAVMISQTTSFVSGSGLPTTGPPISNQHMLVSPESQQLVCLGSNHDNVNDGLYIAVSNNSDFTRFDPETTNNAFDARLSSGSTIVTGIRTRSAMVLFTDLSVYLMQATAGAQIFNIQQIAENNSIIGPNAGVEIDGTIYLMGFRKFFKYDGTYAELTCDVWSKVWNDFNYSLTDKVSCFQNDFFSEVWWLYCSKNATECDRYVVYNYRENTWAYGSINRTCGIRSTKTYGFPLGIDSAGKIWEHENGLNDGTNPIDSWIETYDLQTAENVYRTSGYMWGGDPSGMLGAGTTGSEQIHVSKFIPDMVQLIGNLYLTTYMKTYPGDASYQIKGPYTITPTTKFISLRSRGRLMSMKFESIALGDFWRMDNHTFETQADGER